jgi:hypothetical protein
MSEVLVLSSNTTQRKLGLQMDGKLLIATHLEQSNYLANQKQGAVNKYDLIVFIRHCQGSSRRALWKLYNFSGSHTEHQWRCS